METTDGFYTLTQAQRIALGLRMTRLELHLVRSTALAAGLDPVSYVRLAVRQQLERDLGIEEVAARLTS